MAFACSVNGDVAPTSEKLVNSGLTDRADVVRRDVAEVELRDYLDGPAAVDDEVLVGVGDPELGWVDVAEDGPDERHGTATPASANKCCRPCRSLRARSGASNPGTS